MKGVCHGCKRSDQHRYWKHLDLIKFHFVKVMEHGFSQCMAVPKKFVKNFKGNLSCDLDLKGPSGNLWHIKLKNVKNDLVFKDGWREFVEDHHVEEGDLLVFKCDGDLCFSVLIFDPSGCEREAAYFSTVLKRPQANDDEGHSQEEDRVDVSVEFCYESPSPNVYLSGEHVDERPQVGELSAPRQFASFQKDVTGVPPSSSAAHHKRKTRKEKTTMSSKKSVKKNIKQYHHKGNQGKGDRAWELASRLNLTNPFFPISLRTTHVNNHLFMAIPSGFVAEHLNHKPDTVALHIPNNEGRWDVHFRHYTQSWGFLGQSWKKFVLDNNLEEGDTCVFELSGACSNLRFDVYIFQKSGKETVKAES